MKAVWNLDLLELPCKTCGTVKPSSEFYKRSDGNTLDPRCRQCARERALEYYHSGYRLKKFANKLKNQYGMTVGDYFDLLNAQNGSCAICGREPSPEKRLAVDHDHDTGEVRGLLCNNCNVAIALLGDNLDGLLAAVRYFRDR